MKIVAGKTEKSVEKIEFIHLSSDIPPIQLSLFAQLLEVRLGSFAWWLNNIVCVFLVPYQKEV